MGIMIICVFIKNQNAAATATTPAPAIVQYPPPTVQQLVEQQMPPNRHSQPQEPSAPPNEYTYGSAEPPVTTVGYAGPPSDQPPPYSAMYPQGYPAQGTSLSDHAYPPNMATHTLPTKSTSYSAPPTDPSYSEYHR